MVLFAAAWLLRVLPWTQGRRRFHCSRLRQFLGEGATKCLAPAATLGGTPAFAPFRLFSLFFTPGDAGLKLRRRRWILWGRK
jgi:hypothetical protein